MHVLFLHQNFPAQFRYIAPRLVSEFGWRCTFMTSREEGSLPGIEKILYRCTSGATSGPWRGSAWLALQAQSAYGLDAAQQVRVPGRAVLGSGLRLGRDGWFAEIRIDNLTDAERVDLIGWPLPGRTVHAALGWRGWPVDT